MFKMLGIGDNVVDKYIDLGVMFPGGNAVNVPVLARRLGARCGYIGVLGTDQAGELILSCLQKEDVDVSRVKIMKGTNGYAQVKLEQGERVFLPGDGGVSVNIGLSDADIAYARGFDLIHTSVYSFLEHLLPRMKEAGVPVSFDYSDIPGWDYIDRTIPFVDCAFFSGGDASLAELKDFMKEIAGRGVRYAVVTRGRHGSVYYDGTKFIEQPIVSADVIDTMGAGDAFIAGFLVKLAEGGAPEEAMLAGADYAAKNCALKGAFGYETYIERG